VSDKERGC